ncbi:RING/FYVE/PHD zinc finger superfamily protein [Raphanus sativus]|nr:RING/FYVE/PHD zinc finger superfamily protein [Raphanus sativus]
MGILCDWWHDFLTRCGFFHAIFVERLEEMIRPRNPQLREFGAIRRFLFLLDDNVFAVLAISFYVSFFFVLLPFVMGRLVIAVLVLSQRMGVATQFLSGDSLPQEPVVIGYWTVLSLSLAYLGSFSTLCLAIITKLSLGFLILAAALPYFLWIFSVKVWKNLYVVKLKDGFVLSLKFGVLPLVLGCWLDFCILPIFGTTVSWRLELVSEFPFVMILHWMFGQICLLLFYNSMELIQKILQKRPFWFLLDVTDPSYKITKLYLGQFLFALAFHTSLMVILVHLPIMTISFISTSFFPLQFWIYEERIMFLSMAAYVSLARIRVIEWLVELIKPAVELIVHKWIITVSSWLQLSDFFLGNHANQNVRPLLQQELEVRDSWSLLIPIGEGSLVRFYGSQNDVTSEEDIDDDRFITLRIGLMLVLAALSLFLISTISMALPILVGRTFFHSISFIMIKLGLTHDDLYGFWIGCYILRVIYIGTCFTINHIMIRRTDLLLNLVLLWIRNALLFSIWVSFTPMLLGLLIDLMIVIPTKVPLRKPPVYSLLRDWLIGLVVLHIWTYLTMFTRVKCFATVAWREKLNRIRSVGINTLPWTWLLGNVICPIIGTLLTTLAFPFWVANSLFPLLQFSGAVDLAMQRLIWPVLLAIIIIGFVAKLTLDLCHYIHRVEYDDRYMVGERVADFIEDHL